MTTSLMDERFFTNKTVQRDRHSHVLKSKENIFKPKCNKALKKKLKKYKLRKDGQEDPDIIDVSQTLITSLRIKSPNNPLNIKNRGDTEESISHNYLTNMVRLKKTVVTVKSRTEVNKSNDDIRDENIFLTPMDDQNKKQTDAFKLLMDSRNKSIGSNSPGKEKCDDNSEAQEKIEKKELKAKRNLSLNKMAQAKGSLKKVEIEEYREECIKKKMEDRAKRLKNMIVGTETQNKKNEKKQEMKKTHIMKSVEQAVCSSSEQVTVNIDTQINKSPILKTFDIFKDLKAPPTKIFKNISKEDEEFLNKLSPSMKKKENMLCYFQKISRDSEELQEDCENISQDTDQLIIKVKLTPKTKIKKKKHKHTSDKDHNLSTSNDIVLNHEHKSNSPVLNSNSHKRKRNMNDNKNEAETNIGKTSLEIKGDELTKLVKCNDDVRPKRNTKRPVKYSDDFQLSSSDEELHIFTPKKKRKEMCDNQTTLKPLSDDNVERSKKPNSKSSEKGVKTKLKAKDKSSTKSVEDTTISKGKAKEMPISKKATKLAPIFVTKPQLDSAALEAKQKFLHSGVPIQLKKNSIQQTPILATDEFQTVVHVQNLNNINTMKINKKFNLIDVNYADDIHLRKEENVFKKLLDFSTLENCNIPKFQKDVDRILQDIKKSYPKFPVYRTYHLLKGKSKGDFKDCTYPDLDNSVEIYDNMVDVNNVNPDKLNWADKYKPVTEKQLMGNFESIRELKRWLITWTENNSSKKNKDNVSDSSDFYHSDTDSRETMKNMNNLLVITGKVGTGKTLSVYAVAAELAIKVIEVNASAKRTGKIMLQDLQEATQSHKVDRGKSSTEYSQKSQEIKTCNNKLKVMKKRGRKKKISNNAKPDFETKSVTTKKESTELTVQQENIRTEMSLILIDDADIVFDQDDGFSSAITQLIQTSKRPVILVTSSLTCPHLQKFLHFAKVIKMRPFLPRILGTWLDIMCLVDNNMCSPGLGAKTLDLFRGDIRKTINYLQFFMTSHMHLSNAGDAGMSQNEELKLKADDESSCMSWTDNEGWGEKNIVVSHSDDYTSKYFVRKQLKILHSFSSLNNFNIWWNLPDLLNYSSRNKENMENLTKSEKSDDVKRMDIISNLLDTISITDNLGNLNQFDELDVTSGPWHSCETASVIDNENFTNYNVNNECMNHITHELVSKGVSHAQKVLGCDKTEIDYPSMLMQRKRDRVVSQYKTLSSHLNLFATLDRRALALDYWPSCRNICRTEKTKTDNNSKRNNRFCHYLKSLNVLCRNDYFDNLGEGLINK